MHVSSLSLPLSLSSFLSLVLSLFGLLSLAFHFSLLLCWFNDELSFMCENAPATDTKVCIINQSNSCPPHPTPHTTLSALHNQLYFSFSTATPSLTPFHHSLSSLFACCKKTRKKIPKIFCLRSFCAFCRHRLLSG